MNGISLPFQWLNLELPIHSKRNIVKMYLRCFVFIESQSESLKTFHWVTRFVLHYARYKFFIASISIWFCYLKTNCSISPIPETLPPLQFFFSWGKLHWHIVKTHFPATHAVSRIWEKSFSSSQFLVYRKKTKNSTLNFFHLNLYSNRAHNFVKHLVACLGRHGVSADFLTLSRDRATLGAIFTTTTRNLSACDVIMKMVYYIEFKNVRGYDCLICLKDETNKHVGGLCIFLFPFPFRSLISRLFSLPF